VGAEETSLLCQRRKLPGETALLREQKRHHCCGKRKLHGEIVKIAVSI